MSFYIIKRRSGVYENISSLRKLNITRKALTLTWIIWNRLQLSSISKMIVSLYLIQYPLYANPFISCGYLSNAVWTFVLLTLRLLSTVHPPFDIVLVFFYNLADVRVIFSIKVCWHTLYFSEKNAATKPYPWGSLIKLIKQLHNIYHHNRLCNRHRIISSVYISFVLCHPYG